MIISEILAAEVISLNIASLNDFKKILKTRFKGPIWCLFEHDDTIRITDRRPELLIGEVRHYDLDNSCCLSYQFFVHDIKDFCSYKSFDDFYHELLVSQVLTE